MKNKTFNILLDPINMSPCESERGKASGDSKQKPQNLWEYIVSINK